MLMLVVTIVIAAVVTLFATGVVTSTEKAPVAVLDVNIYKSADVGGTMSSTYAPDFTIDHIAGDPLKTSDLKITVDWETNDSTPVKVTNIFEGSNPIKYTAFNYDSNPPALDDEMMVNQPLYLNDPSLDELFDLTHQYWGAATLTTGGHIQTVANYLVTEKTHTGNPFFDIVMGTPSVNVKATSDDSGKYSGGAAGKLDVGTLVHVVITHVPSGSILFDKEVRVQ
ncbi:MAG TPA: type IV pilin, partial [Methanocorpusculum sp.]|nr:type IV pilin [Methanocorpusculum sp.]